MATYVCSDIHGQFFTWLSAIAKSGLSLENGDKFIILGDLIDRGEESLACVKYALELKERYPNQVTYLRGNHEQLFLDFVNIRDPLSIEGYMDLQMIGGNWLLNGGRKTVSSFFPKSDTSSLVELHKMFNESYSEIIQKLNELPYYKVDEELNCVYVHAGFETGKPLEQQDKLNMLWIREGFLDGFKACEGDVLKGKIIVHGHTPVQYMHEYSSPYNGQGFYKGEYHLNVDGGAALRDKLLVVKIDDLTYVEEKIK